MKQYTSSFFGKVDLNSDTEDYDAKLNYENRVIELDLNICLEEKPNVEQLSEIDDFLKKLREQEVKIRAFIDADFKNKGETKDYIEEHLEEDYQEELAYLIDENDKKKTAAEQLLSKIYLHRVGFYPNHVQFAVFDFYVDHEVSDQILVVTIENDKSYSIAWES